MIQKSERNGEIAQLLAPTLTLDQPDIKPLFAVQITIPYDLHSPRKLYSVANVRNFCRISSEHVLTILR